MCSSFQPAQIPLSAAINHGLTSNAFGEVFHGDTRVGSTDHLGVVRDFAGREVGKITPTNYTNNHLSDDVCWRLLQGK